MASKTWIRVGILAVASTAVLACLAATAVVLGIGLFFKHTFKHSDEMSRSVQYAIDSCSTEDPLEVCAQAFGRTELSGPRPQFPPEVRDVDIWRIMRRKGSTRVQGTAFFGASAPLCFTALFVQIDEGWALDSLRSWPSGEDGCDGDAEPADTRGPNAGQERK